jgi:two-component system phosphate regulon response regulator PhoB
VTEPALILCADDDADILNLLALRLERAGYRVVQAVDGEQALALARDLAPTLAVLDVMMPRLTGTEVLEALRADPATRDLRVILLSARAQESDVERGLAAGANAYLAKPFQAPELLELVERLLA